MPADRLSRDWIGATTERTGRRSISGSAKANGARHASAPEKRDIGLIGIDALVPANIVEHVENDARALPGRHAVALPCKASKTTPMFLAHPTSRSSIQRRVARGNEDHERPGGGLVA